MAKQGDFDFYCEEALSGKTKIRKVYESQSVLAFYHTKPKFKTHIVIIPKEHIHNLMGANNRLLSEMLDVAKKIFREINVDSFGGRLITNLGKFQETPHLHIHIVSDGDYPNIKLTTT